MKTNIKTNYSIFAFVFLLLLAAACQQRALGVQAPGAGGDADQQREALIADYTSVIQSGTDDATKEKYYFLRGKVRLEMHDYDKGIEDFSAAIAIRPEDGYAFVERGDCYLGKKDYEKALADFDQNIKLEPKNFKVMANRGVVYDAMGDYDKAIEAYTESIGVNPNFAKTHLNRAWDYRQVDKPDNALADCNIAVELDPKNPEAYNSRGETYIALKQPDSALADFDKAISIDPKYARAYAARGHMRMENGDNAKAKEDLTQAVELDPKSAYVLNDLAWLISVCPQAEVRDGKKAVEYATKACELTGWKEPRHIDTLAAAYAEAGDFDNAVKYEEQFVKTPGMGQEDIDRANGLIELYKSHKPYHMGN